MTAAGQVNTNDTPWAISHRPTPVERPKSSNSKKPQTVGGSTMGMVKTESSRPLTLLEVPAVFHAAKSPKTNETASATALVLIDTQNGR